MKPPCVALLDGDAAGKEAARVLRRGEARNKRVLADECIVEMPAWMASAGVEVDEGVAATEIEDLIPLPLLREPALSYLGRFLRTEDINEDAFTVDAVQKSVAAKKGNAWEGLSDAYQKAFVGGI